MSSHMQNIVMFAVQIVWQCLISSSTIREKNHSLDMMQAMKSKIKGVNMTELLSRLHKHTSFPLTVF